MKITATVLLIVFIIVLQLPAGFNRQAVLNAMRGHVIAKGEMVGVYQRKGRE
ncbi:MAG: hypothetical protein QOF02_1061 [Blastocatellia bacterium]|nr:hypothetical protein [Blastocatellia bacterium]